MVLMGYRCTKQGHETIAQELIDGALIAVHLVERQFEETVQQGVHRLRPNVLCQSSRISQIAEQHRNLFAFAFESTAGGENLLSKMLRGIGKWCRLVLCKWRRG
jgi:hypothetical protein